METDKLEIQKDKGIADTYKEIGKIIKLIGGAGKLQNDVLGGQLKTLLRDEMRTQHEFLNRITNGGKEFEESND